MNRLVPHLPVQLLSLPGKDGLDFELPPQLEASEPPEASGLARDEVRLMVSYRSKNRVVHTQFRQLGDFLEAGDLLVINTSGTMNAAIRGQREDGTPVEVHLSTHLPDDLWTVEVRASLGKMTHPLFSMRAGEMVRLDGDGEVVLHAPYRPGNRGPVEGRQRLWIASLHLPQTLQDYLARYGFPIRYSYVREQWPLEYYQTVYATEMGSAEMPSAGRGFTTELITKLVAQGVQFAPLLLHTGVASLEEDEPPYEEFYRVPAETARIIRDTKAAGKRVIAVGTTVIRALETVTDEKGIVHPGEGWTDVVITPERGIRSVHGLLTGLHEPRATHLWMLEALAGREHLELTYAEALREGYLWHEFGDLYLILP
ncbi:MAG TPA: S-adenosylmethionine:tRNA ribosyltransferase-isomerase [Ktedonobacteraceae bacterium]|jgi:S-adenosylmethionine:tRNA ribosyltransferase-isomerase|nr:S-adenosylmethionine:tRNA ribosyltransferase-isomerase [Ktedonobacteraceae bacterium]